MFLLKNQPFYGEEFHIFLDDVFPFSTYTSG